MGLSAGRGSRFCPPRRDGRVGEPDGQAAAAPQCRVVLRLVRDPISGSRNMMTVFDMVFERHGTEFPVVNGPAGPISPSPATRSLQQGPGTRSTDFRPKFRTYSEHGCKTRLPLTNYRQPDFAQRM